MKCDTCGTNKNVKKARNEEGEIVGICDNCYEKLCEGYELID